MYISGKQQAGAFHSLESRSSTDSPQATGGRAEAKFSERELGGQCRRLSSQLADLSDRLGVLGRGISEGPSTLCSNEPGAANEAALVQSLISARRRRTAFFAADLFADPAWDIFLDLYLAELEQRRVMTTSLGVVASIPPTTTLRWINALVERGFLTRRPDPLDRRRVYVMLTPQSKQAMRDYLNLKQA